MKLHNKKAAILVPTAPFGAYWPPILSALDKKFGNLRFYTGRVWPKFDPNESGAEIIKIVGNTKVFTTQYNADNYNRGFILASPKIIFHLLSFQPDFVYVSGFSVWTFLAILFKFLGRWKIVLLYEGSSPTIDCEDSGFRSLFRMIMIKFVDTFISNSAGGCSYLANFLGVDKENIYSRPYMVPDSGALLRKLSNDKVEKLNVQHPVFLFVGQITKRKGIHLLLEACHQLKEMGLVDFTLLIAGDGEKRFESEEQVKKAGLSDQVVWLGWVEYGSLGTYFEISDVFMFPTLEDTWGMVLLEAMAFGKASICSKWAGAKEMVLDGVTGYIVDPYNVSEVSKSMAAFITDHSLAPNMGKEAKREISKHLPEAAADFLAQIATKIL